MKYPHLASKLYNTPLLVDPAKAAVIEQVFRSHLLGTPKPDAKPEDFLRPDAAMGTVRYQNRQDRPYPITEGGVAVIPVVGTLVQRGDSLDAMSGLIGYNRIERQLAVAVEDPAAKAILLEIDSPGGEANGCFDLAARIIEARAAKPIWAHANEQAFSAAYALAVSAGKLLVPPTGLVGSIGVIALHVDQSKRDMSQGYAYTAVYAGERKNDFSSHQPLTDQARQVLQAEVDRMYGIFVAHVARSLGIDEKRVRATEAGLLNPEAALAGGFVHQVAGFVETVELLEAQVRPKSGAGLYRLAQPVYPSTAALAASQPQQETAMKTVVEAAAAPTAPAAPTTAAAPAAPETPAAAPVATAAAPDAAAIEASAKARIKEITTCEEARGREQLAGYLAFETTHSVDEAKKLLVNSPKSGDPAMAGAQFATTMAALGNPKVGAGGEDVSTTKPALDTSAIYASRRPQPVKP